MIIIIESMVMCFILLLICVIGIANGPTGLVNFYEKDVQDRVVKLGLTTKKKINRNSIISIVPIFASVIIIVPIMVYYINGKRDFWDIFWQISIILWIMGLFDRIFIDWYWVGHTRAWLIPGTEDLMPYVPVKTAVKKWLGTMIGYPVFAAIIAGVMMLFIK